MNSRRAVAAGIVMIMTLSACGFQLRGAFQVPEALGTVHLSSENPGSPILNSVRRAMVSSGVQLVDSDQDAPYSLHLSRERSEKRSISVDSLAAAAEFQLRQFVSYELRSRRGELLVGPHQLIVERNFQNDINNVVGKRDEERLIREEMQVLLASQIMRRYQAIDAAQLHTSGSELSVR